MYFAPETARFDVRKPHPLTGATLPQILGHEFSGTVVEVGDDVREISVDDRVTVWPVYYCGTCAACRVGRHNACQTIGFHGLSASGGGMAEFTTVPASKVHKLPANVDLRLGALVEPMAVAWRAVSRSRVGSAQTALIAGAGPIGIGVWFALRARGVERVLVSEPSHARRDVIAALGATVVDPLNDDLASAVAELTDGDGVHVAFDAAGAGPALASAIHNLVPGGRVVVVAIHERPMELLPTLLARTETEILGSFAYLPQDFDEVIQAMADGAYDTTGWVKEVELDSVGDAVRELRAGRAAKVLVRSDARTLNSPG
jgi:(R,R)-butanediol dehydrogenase/meso-butanediol dehydrogenase/diacetyl reductase